MSSVEYTPEYSQELLALVTELYCEEIRPALGDLKLSKMIDLLEVAQWNLEQYRAQLQGGSHIELLKHYIVGLLYVYLVIPASIQFQFKNKNYEIFLVLKQLYEKETNMSNVKSVTLDYITYINDKAALPHQVDALTVKSRSKRSSTLPSSSLEPDLSRYLKPPAITTTHSNSHNLEKQSQMSRTHSGADILSLASTNSSVVDDLWQPPDLQPNDQLRLATEHDYASNDDLANTEQLPPLPSHPPPPAPELPAIIEVPTPQQQSPSRASQVRFSSPPLAKLHYRNSFPEGHIQDASPQSEGSEFDNIPEEGYRVFFEPNTTHRKDSYHSVYAEDDETVQSIQTVTSKSLLEQLKAGQLSILLIDIRSHKRFDSNHIPFDNIINIDPSLVVNSNSFQELQDIVYSSLQKGDFTKFLNMNKYDEVLVYTDSSTLLKSEVDYLVKFIDLLKENRVKCKSLRGGFDSWTKFLSKSNILKPDLTFVVKYPFVAPAPPSVPPPPVPTERTRVDLSPRSSTPMSEQAQVQAFPNSTSSSSIQADPPVPPLHMSQPQGPRPYPIQQSFYHTQHELPSQQHIVYESSYNQQFQTPQMYPTPYPQQYNRPAVPVPHHSSPVYTHHRPYQPHPYNNNSRQSYSAHDRTRELQRRRINSESIPTIQRSSNLFVRLSITGLRNMGNTCYINSMIQCLFGSTFFRDIFLDNTFEEYANPTFNKPRLAPSLSILFKKMYLNGGCSIVPSGFLKTCVQLRPDLRIPSEQQDTQEFLMFMLDHLHDELSNSNSVVNDYPELMSHDDLGEEYDKWFDGLIKMGISPISKFFQGQLQDSLQCKNCGHKSSNYSTFYMLSLVIPKQTQSGGFGKKTTKKVSLEDCIEMFTHDEVLTGDNAWDCPKCAKKREQHNGSSTDGSFSLTPISSNSKPVEKERKHRLHFTNGFKLRGRSSSPAPKKEKERDQKESRWNRKSNTTSTLTPPPGATFDSDGIGFSHSKKKSLTVKSLTFVVLPPVLIIHLSRFLFYDTSQKDTAIVQYPLILEIPHKGEMVRYKLFGVVNHDGTLKSGHYTSIANKNLQHDLVQPDWFYFDDETVKHTDHGSLNGKDPVHMSSSEVYVLFYERI